MKRAFGLPEDRTFRIDIQRSDYFEIHWGGFYLSYDGINLFVYKGDENTYLRTPHPFDKGNIPKVDLWRLQRIRGLLTERGGLFSRVENVPLGKETLSYLRTIADAVGIEATLENSGVDYAFHPMTNRLQSTDPERTRGIDRARELEGLRRTMGKDMVLNPLLVARKY